MTLKEAEMARALEDAKATRDLKERTLEVSTFGATMTDDKLDALSSVGITPSIDGSAIYDGKKYNSINDAVDALPAGDQAAYKANIALGSRDSAGERIRADVLDSAGDVRERLAQLSGLITSSDINIRDSVASTHLEAMSQFRTTQGAATAKSRFTVKKGNKDEQALKTIFGDSISLSDNRNYYVLEDPNTQEYMLVDESGTLIGTDKRLLETLKDPPPTDPKDPPPTDPSLSGLSSAPELAEIAADLQLTGKEQADIQEDGRLKAATRALQKAEENLEATLAGTKNMNVVAIEKNIERHKKTIEKRLRELYGDIPRQRRTRLSRNKRPRNKSADSIVTAQDDTTTGS